MRAQMPIRSELARGRKAPEEWARIDPIIYVTEARRRQAQATAEAIGTAWRGIRRGLAGLAGLVRRHLLEPLARRSERRAALADLAALDDRLLADIGIRRSDLQLAVEGRLADPRVRRRARAAVADHLLEGERFRAPARPERQPDLAA
jgi:hypothetical protein